MYLLSQEMGTDSIFMHRMTSKEVEDARNARAVK